MTVARTLREAPRTGLAGCHATWGATRARARPAKPTRGARTVAIVVGLGVVLAGCAGDDGGITPQPIPAGGNRPPAPVNPAGTNVKTQPLPEKLHIEDRVSCSIPDKPTDPKDGACDPKVPSCGEHLYCLSLAQGSFCEPCPERDGIRHAFNERDFVLEQNRDPFQSPFMPQVSSGKPSDSLKLEPTKVCKKDRMVATSYSYTELKLVGVVTQGTLHRALMMGGSLGYIIKRGDCVGRDKAVVKDIGNDYITFVIEPDAFAASPRTTEYSVRLNPQQLAAGELETSPPPRRANPPSVSPPSPPSPSPPSSPQAGSGSGAAVAPVAPKKP